MHDTAELYGFICGEIHLACRGRQPPLGPGPDDGCPPGAACVAHDVFGFQVEKRLSYETCGAHSRVATQALWAHIAYAHRLGRTSNRFETNLATVYDAPVECRKGDGGCGAKGHETEELLTVPGAFIISESPPLSKPEQDLGY